VTAAAPALSGWENFFVIVGSSGGALVGLQFVVLTLVAERTARTTPDTVNAFGTPTVEHHTGALNFSALMSVPWRSLAAAATAVVLCGLAGIVYALIVIRRARRQSVYAADREDWAWYIILPGAVYVVLTVAGFALPSSPAGALLTIGGCALGLLFLGVRNAWDTVTYVVAGHHHEPPVQ
jgi:ABC-type spermidine/putrescine transport system permease subunit I